MPLKLLVIPLLLVVLTLSDAHADHPSVLWQHQERAGFPVYRGDQQDRPDAPEDAGTRRPHEMGKLAEILQNQKKWNQIRRSVQDEDLPYYLLNALQSELQEKEKADFSRFFRNYDLPPALYRSDNRRGRKDADGREEGDRSRSLTSNTLPLFLGRSDTQKERGALDERKKTEYSRFMGSDTLPFSLNRNNSPRKKPDN